MELEGLLTQLKLEEALHNDMRPNYAFGIDGVTVNFLAIISLADHSSNK